MPPVDQTQKRIAALQQGFVNTLNIGEFRGHFTLEWTGPDSFNYHPDPADPFQFVRDLGNGKTEIIQPGAMTTDGGTIPLVGQFFAGTPWEYGPAYMLHDWEFHRHDVDSGFKKSFKEVNLTLAEAIWTLMNKGYLKYKKPRKSYKNVYTIYSGVMSPIGKAIWDAK